MDAWLLFERQRVKNITLSPKDGTIFGIHL